MVQFSNGESIVAVALATPVDQYVPVREGSAVQAVANAVQEFNSAMEPLKSTPFTLWEAEQVQALGTGYTAVETACSDSGNSFS